MWEKLGLKIAFDEKRTYGLDILRAFAISIVVLTHSVTYLPATITNLINYIALDGVSIFFVLSGFLIGQILIKSMMRREIDFYTLLNFWWRRWLRTLPIYFLIFSLVLFVYNYPTFNSAPTFKRFYIFSQNIYTPHPGFFIEAWSLSVEEWFYLLIPFLIFIFIRFFKIKVFTSILIISVVVILFSTAIRMERYFTNFPINEYKFALLLRMQVITRLDSLMYGVLGALFAVFYHERWMIRNELKLIIGIAILVINKAFAPGQNEMLGFYQSVFFLSLNSIGTLLMLPFLSNYKTGQGFIFKMVTYLSLISYSLYLINLTPMQDYIMPFINNHIIKNMVNVQMVKNIDLLLYLPISIFGSIYLYKFIESPILKYRDKINFGIYTRIPVNNIR